MEKKEIIEEVFQAVYRFGFVHTVKTVCGAETQLQIPFFASFYREPIEILQLSVRSTNCLRRTKIDTVEKLIDALEKGNLQSVRGLGKNSLAEIRVKLVEAGFFALPQEKQKQVIEQLLFA